MNIGFDAKRFFLNQTGLGNYSRDLVKGILEKEEENNYFLYTPEGEVDLRTKFLSNRENVQIVYPTGIFKKFKSYWRSIRLEKELVKNKIDVFHGLSHEIPKKRKNSKIKYVVTIHDLIFIRYPKNYPAVDRKIYLKKVKYACDNADKVIAISEQTKKDIIEFLNIPANKIEVIYQTCAYSFTVPVNYQYKDVVQKKYNLPENFILNVGTIETRKNLAILVEAIGKTHTQLPLVVVGRRTEYLDEVWEKVVSSGLEKQVAFLENVSFLDLPAIYQMANLFVYPSVFEGFGIPILEALYSRIPVISATGSCLEEAGGEHSIYVDPKNSDELAEKIDLVIESPDLQLKMKEEGYKYASKFNSEKQAELVLDLYNKL